jgi:peptide/nickel transport system substrate-binding protein
MASLSRVASGFGARATLDAIVGAKAYDAGLARRIAGVVARGNTLKIMLTRPMADFPERLAQPFFCAVPRDTPVKPGGVERVDAAGPYYVAAYEPGSHIILKRNPNYPKRIGGRPQKLAEIRIALGVDPAEGVSLVEAGHADYSLGSVPASERSRLARRYGPGSAAARAGRQQYFVNPTLSVWFIALNTSRPLFSSVKVRQAVNYAIDRDLLGRLASGFLVTTPTDQYLPPGIRGFRDRRIYPATPDLEAARRLLPSDARRRRAVLYTCPLLCLRVARAVEDQLEVLGIDVDVQQLPFDELRKKLGTRGEPFDLAFNAWSADYPDPEAFLSVLFDGTKLKAIRNENISYFDDESYNRKLVAAARMTGPRRYDAFGRLDVDLAQNAAPIVAVANEVRHDFFSSRMRCQIFHPVYGMDLAAMCVHQS